MIKTKVQVYFVSKKIELVPATAAQSAEESVPRLSHHPVEGKQYQKNFFLHDFPRFSPYKTAQRKARESLIYQEILQNQVVLIKGRFRTNIFKSAETVYLLFVCYLGDAIRRAMSADSKMVACYRPLIQILFSLQQQFQKGLYITKDS